MNSLKITIVHFFISADFLVHAEEGKALPIKIEFPVSALSSIICGCKSLLNGFRIIILLGFLVLLAWSTVALYANYFSIIKSQSNKFSLLNEQPLYDSKINKLSIQKEVYELVKKDVNSSTPNDVDITTKFIHDIAQNNSYENEHSVHTVSHLTFNNGNINVSKSSLQIKNFDDSESPGMKSLKTEKFNKNNLKDIDLKLKEDIIDGLPVIVSITNNTFNSVSEINKDQDNIDTEHSLEIEGADDVVNLLLEEIVNTILSDQTSDEYVESNENLSIIDEKEGGSRSEEKKNSEESADSSQFKNSEDRDNDSLLKSSEDSVINSSLKDSEDSDDNSSIKSSINIDDNSFLKNSQENDDNSHNEDSENSDNISLETYLRNQDNSSHTETEIDDISKQQKWSIFKIHTIDFNENNTYNSNESISIEEEEESNDDYPSESSIQEELNSKEEKENLSEESKYHNKVGNNSNEYVNSDESSDDEDIKSISMENISKEEELHREIHKMSEKSFPFLADRLISIVGEHYTLLSWYYNNKNNSNFLNENDKLTVYTAKLLYSTNIHEFLVDLNVVIDLITQDSYNKNYKEFSNLKYDKIKNYIIHRLTKKMDIYNFVVKYFQYDKIAMLIIEVLNKSELNQLDSHALEINEDSSILFEKENFNDGTLGLIEANEPITENYNYVQNQRFQLLESMKKVIKFNDNLSPQDQIKDNVESKKSDLESFININTESKERSDSNNNRTAEKVVPVSNEAEENDKSVVVKNENISTKKLEESEDEMERKIEWPVNNLKNINDYKDERVADTINDDIVDDYDK
jgi:hypothetical protein